jgi:predicted DNA binding protein
MNIPVMIHSFLQLYRKYYSDIEEHHFIFASNNVERELNKCLEQEIIERIEGTPTSWVSPIITPHKKNSDEIRLGILFLGQTLGL